MAVIDQREIMARRPIFGLLNVSAEGLSRFMRLFPWLVPVRLRNIFRGKTVSSSEVSEKIIEESKPKLKRKMMQSQVPLIRTPASYMTSHKLRLIRRCVHNFRLKISCMQLYNGPSFFVWLFTSEELQASTGEAWHCVGFWWHWCRLRRRKNQFLIDDRVIIIF